MVGFGKRLRKVRGLIGLDQKAFGIGIGIAGRDTISRWERGLGFPSADTLFVMRQKYSINIDWLISGEGKLFIEGGVREGESEEPISLPIDPVEQLLAEEEERAGITLNSKQRTAILKILRELVSRDVRSIRELLQTITGGMNQGQE